jgi:hypothetical protein
MAEPYTLYVQYIQFACIVYIKQRSVTLVQNLISALILSNFDFLRLVLLASCTSAKNKESSQAPRYDIRQILCVT